MTGRRFLQVLLAVVCAAVLLAACSKTVAAQADPGDCIEELESGSVEELEKVDCDESHVAEVFAVLDLDDGDFPGTDEVTSLAAEACLDEFEDYVGVAYNDSEYEIFPIAPSEESWNDAEDREVICLAGNPDQSELEGSIAE